MVPFMTGGQGGLSVDGSSAARSGEATQYGGSVNVGGFNVPARGLKDEHILMGLVALAMVLVFKG